VRGLSLLSMSLLTAMSAGVASMAIAVERQVLPGPIPAIVERVIDGDTIEVRAQIWVGQEVRVKVRLSNVDTPELNGKCRYERRLAHYAKSFVVQEIAGAPVLLTNIRHGKYAGRVIAEIETASGQHLGARLLHAGLAKPYRKRRYGRWCCLDDRCSGGRLSFTSPARKMTRP